jgi:hypothetical protein
MLLKAGLSVYTLGVLYFYVTWGREEDKRWIAQGNGGRAGT